MQQRILKNLLEDSSTTLEEPLFESKFSKAKLFVQNPHITYFDFELICSTTLTWEFLLLVLPHKFLRCKPFEVELIKKSNQIKKKTC